MLNSTRSRRVCSRSSVRSCYLMKRIALILLAAALLMPAPTLPAQAQTNSVVVPSASGVTQSAPSGDDTGTPPEAGKPATHKAAHHKKKKTSFMRKMRDKATQKVQKLLGSKTEPKQEPNSAQSPSL